MKHPGGSVNPPADTGAGARPAAPPDVSPDARRRRWHGHRQARRAQLVEAAIRVIRRDGPNAGMDGIAAEAGVSKPVLYRHFTDQAELYLAVGQRVAGTLLRALRTELEHQRAPRAHVAAVIGTYLGAIEAEPELYRFVTRRTFANRPVERDLVADYTTLIAAGVSRVLGDRLRAGGHDPEPAGPWGHGVVGLVQAAGDWWLDHRTISRAELTEQLTDLVWTGLAGGLAGAPPG
ncbi:MAG TPA: TetR/AcrR family transcriptional regulator [Mycobacteriales bacterium]|nr:TetR/AcrR family transcriptional regulator [Mycobacteriales bacterium]